MNKTAFFIGLLVLVLSSPAHANQEFFPYLAEVTEESVNMRAGVSTNFEKLCKLQKGDELIIVDRSYSWLKVELPKIASSYISSEFVLLVEVDRGEVIADRVNVRAGADTGRTVLAQLNKADQVKVLEYLDGWYKIEPVDNSYGFISDQFLAFKDSDISTYSPQTLVAKYAPQMLEENRSIEETVQENLKSVKISGYINISGSSVAPKVYRLQIDRSGSEIDPETKKILGQASNVYLSDLSSVPPYFLRQKVSVDGKLATHDEGDARYPLLNVSRIQLTL